MWLSLHNSCGTFTTAKNINLVNNINTHMIHQYSISSLAQTIEQNYGLVGTITQLAGYTDKNFMLIVEREGSSQKYTVKISSNLQNKYLIGLQNYVFKKLKLNQQLFHSCTFPTLVPTLSGQDMLVLSKDGKYNFLRVLTYIEGKQIWQLEDAPSNLFSEAGTIAATLSLFLSSISNDQQVEEEVIPSSNTHYFNICTFNPHFEKYYEYLDAKLKPLVLKVRSQFNQVLPILQTLPKQILHNDICLSNLLVQANSSQWFISGLIDFSSMIYSYQIIELVILCARINIFKPDPLRNMLLIIAAYNKVRKLSAIEIQLLFPLIKTRLAFLCLLSSYLAHQKDGPYFLKCKNGHIYYLQTIANHCTTQQFIQRVNKEILE